MATSNLEKCTKESTHNADQSSLTKMVALNMDGSIPGETAKFDTNMSMFITVRG